MAVTMRHQATASTGYTDGLRYTVQGSGPALVLVCTLAGIWSAQVRALSENHTVVTYDMRHFGRSASRDAAYPDLAGHARDLRHLIDHLSLDRPVIVGLSHGGIVLQHFAREFPDHSAGLVFVSTLIKALGQTRLLLNLLHGYLLDNDMAGFWRVLRTLLFSEPAFASFAQREDLLKRRMFNQLTVDCLKNIYVHALAHDGTGWLPAVSTT